MLIILLSTTHSGCVLVRTVHKSWLHYAVMCVCVCWLLESGVGGVYKSPVALSLWWFQSAKGWQDCTKERNMSSIQNEPYVHTHTLCINVWSRLWIIDVSLLFVPLVSCSPLSLSVHPTLFLALINPVLCLSLPQDAAASVKPSWLDEERTTDYQYGRATCWSFPQSLVLW